MLNDSQYFSDAPYPLAEQKHAYGPQVHLLNDPYLFSTLALMGKAACKQPLLHMLLTSLYRGLVSVLVNREFPKIEETIETRMHRLHPEGVFRARVLDPLAEVVCVNLARAGTVPSQTCFEFCNYLFRPEGVRQDHISMNRKTNDKEEVVGVERGGIKIGGETTGKFVVFPDPMGATGSTLCSALELYKKKGKAKAYAALHLIVTPEYLARLNREHPDLSIYAIRLDRGLSDLDVLSTVPGTEWAKERGLNSHQYIVPGAGGLGEVINNADV